MKKMRDKSFKLWLFVFLAAVLCVTQVVSHGRLIEPPSRASAWRYGFETPPNYNDHELYCGGFSVQWNRNGGKCGECGDAWNLNKPRPHEFGGKWGQGVIVRRYNPSSSMTIRVELTASHMGYFEFRLCDNAIADQDCLDKHLLKVMGGAPTMPGPNDLETRFYPRNGSRIYEIRAKLPEGFKCAHCVLQWRYIAGNNWGTCEDGTGAVGCGPQEEFRACADVAIGEGKGTQPRPSRPSIKPKPAKPQATDEVTLEPVPGGSDELPSKPPYFGLLMAVFSLFLVLCGFIAVYIYHYHGKRFKLFMRWNQNKKTAPELPPVPPPRTRRNLSHHDISAPSIFIEGGNDKNCDSMS